MARGRIAGIGAATLAIATLVSGCSWRMDTEPEPFRSPSQITMLRDDVAAAEAAVASAAAVSDDPLAGVELAAVPVRLTALGGVSPTSSPRPDASLAEALDGASDATTACMDNAGDDPLGGLCASIALSHAVILAAPERFAWEALAYLAEPVTLPGADSAVPSETLALLALEHDRLRALYEVIAARTTGEERTAAREQSSGERARVASLLAIEGVEDLTEPAYAIPADASSALAARVTIAEAYAALMVGAAPQDREWLLNSAVVAYRGALANGLPISGVPALPGAIQPSPSPTAS